MNASGTPVSATPITVTKTGTGNISFTPATGTTDLNGKFAVTVSGVAGGSGVATLTAAALGATASSDITVTTLTSSFAITGLTLQGTALTSAATNSFSATSMKKGESLVVTVTAPPPAANVWFTSVQGTWSVSGTNTQQVAVAGGTASATLTTTNAGKDTVQVFDPLNATTATDTLTVGMTAVTPNSITLQATPSVVPKGANGTSTVIATVVDSTGSPVGGVPVAFSIVNPTGGGETVSPVVSFTATSQTASLNLGQASATFTAGSSSSIQSGVKVRATVLGTTVVTGTAPSGSDAAIVIGGSPSSVAFGQATVLGVNANASQYILAMSVIVSDSNGNPAPAGTLVNLSLWPIAWSTGTGCTPDPDGLVWNGLPTNPRVYVAGNGGTYYNEDVNENLILDSTLVPLYTEDGVRTYYAGGTTAVPVAGTTATKDTYITPGNSVAGTIPATVTTDANGVGTFNLTYPKTSGIWVVDRIRGRTVVQGSDAVGEVQFRLGVLKSDAEPCILPPSPFNY